MKKKWIIYLFLGLIVCIGLVVLVSFYPVPVRVFTEYPMQTLLEEGVMMHECAECHEGTEFHSCDSCHSDHGAVLFDEINFYSTVHITGDVDRELYLPVNMIFIEEETKVNKINFLDFLENYNIGSFDEVVFYTNDGGFVTVTKDNFGNGSYLVPFEDGIRFIDEDLHESTWLKSIIKIIVIGKQNNFLVNNDPVSYGKLLSEEAIDFTVERAKVSYKNEESGSLKSAETATRIEGIPITSIIGFESSKAIEIITNDGVLDFTMDEIIDSKLTLIKDQIVIVLANQSRKDWVTGVKEIRTE